MIRKVTQQGVIRKVTQTRQEVTQARQEVTQARQEATPQYQKEKMKRTA